MAPPRTIAPPDIEILRAIDRLVSAGAQPSVRQLAGLFGFKSPAPMHRHLVRLRGLGLVTADEGLGLTAKGRTVARGVRVPLVETMVNVGGPDGPTPGGSPPCTVGTLVVPYDGPEARSWLYRELDKLRGRYVAEWGVTDPSA